MQQSKPELPRILVVMALPSESQGLFEERGLPVFYCGVGKVNAAITLTKHLARYTHAGQPLPLVVNFGTAGSHHHGVGTFVACTEFIQRDMDVSGLGFEHGVTPFEDIPPTLSFKPMFTRLPSAICGSGDSFATTVHQACTVVDMEAYALAKVCWLERASFACVKYITDGSDHNAADDWQNNVHKAAREFLELYLALERELSN